MAKSKPKAAPKKKESAEELKKRAIRVSNTLRKIYGKEGTALRFSDPFQLLAATILSAQCTDEQVNRTTPALFARFPGAKEMAAADPAELEKIIHATGFFRQKTKSLINCSKSLLEKFGGVVPESMDDLTTLTGVGRKTANLVRAEAFGNPGIVVDTHFRRLIQRMGIVDSDDPTKIEMRIAELLPPSHWTEFSHSLIWHGRRICFARKPNCPECPVLKDCPYGQAEMAKQ